MKRVAVVMGGISAEREVSLSSGRQVAAALREAGFAVTPIEAGPSLGALIAAIASSSSMRATASRSSTPAPQASARPWA
jgi:D-alanine-D-alanine ligase